MMKWKAICRWVFFVFDDWLDHPLFAFSPLLLSSCLCSRSLVNLCRSTGFMLEDSQFLQRSKLITVYGRPKINVQKRTHHILVLHRVLSSYEGLLKVSQALDATVWMQKMSNQIAGIGKVGFTSNQMLIITASKIL